MHMLTTRIGLGRFADERRRPFPDCPSDPFSCHLFYLPYFLSFRQSCLSVAPTLFSQAYHATSYKLPQPEPSSCYSCRVSQLSHRDASLSCDQCPCSRRARAYSLTGSPTTPCVSFS